jgi:hypothetical protein
VSLCVRPRGGVGWLVGEGRRTQKLKTKELISERTLTTYRLSSRRTSYTQPSPFPDLLRFKANFETKNRNELPLDTQGHLEGQEWPGRLFPLAKFLELWMCGLELLRAKPCYQVWSLLLLYSWQPLSRRRYHLVIWNSGSQRSQLHDTELQLKTQLCKHSLLAICSPNSLSHTSQPPYLTDVDPPCQPGSLSESSTGLFTSLPSNSTLSPSVSTTKMLNQPHL